MQLFKIASRNFNVIFSHQRLVKLWSYTSWQVDCMTLFVYMKTINDKPYDFFSFLYNTLHVFFLFLFTNKVEHSFVCFVLFICLFVSSFVCLYLHFVVYSSASDLKQQWEVNPSPTPSLQVDAFYSSHLCVFLFLYYFWVCILSLYFRSRTSPCLTVQSQIR